MLEEEKKKDEEKKEGRKEKENSLRIFLSKQFTKFTF
jgi:hypothetical protein